MIDLVDDGRVSAVLVVVPARDEQERIGACLHAIRTAATLVRPSVHVRVVVALDDCRDRTAMICAHHGVDTISVTGGVGQARSAGVAHLARLTATARERVWLANTDADTVVPPSWLADQLKRADAGADAVFGVVDVVDWSRRPAGAALRFAEHYRGAQRANEGSHPHVHGANLGVRLSAYEGVGGFDTRRVGEDQSLADRLEVSPGVRIDRTTALRVVTSARSDPRAALGFGELLDSL